MSDQPLSPARLAAELNEEYDKRLRWSCGELRFTMDELLASLDPYHRERFIVRRVAVLSGPIFEEES